MLIGLKTTANAALATLLPALVGRETALLTLQNGLGNEEQLAELFGPERVLGGLCFVCLNRVAPGLIHHAAHGDIILGEFGRPPLLRTAEYAESVSRRRRSLPVTEDLARAHWEKLLWNVPFNGLGVAGAAGYPAVMSGQLTAGQALSPCLTTDQLLADSRWLALVRELMGEVITAAAALGVFPSPRLIEERIEKTRLMGAYRASTLVDFERGQPLELESLFLAPLRRAHRPARSRRVWPRSAGSWQRLIRRKELRLNS